MPRVDSTRRTVLTVSEVGNYLRIHPSTIYRMLKKHELPAPRVGSDWRFTVRPSTSRYVRIRQPKAGRPCVSNLTGFETLTASIDRHRV